MMDTLSEDNHHHHLIVKRSIVNPPTSNCYLTHYLSRISPQDLLVENENISSSSFLDGDSCYVGSSCDGLLCFDAPDGRILLWDPTNEQFKFLPPSDVPRPPGIGDVRYDSSALGFDSKSNDYKVIRFMTLYYQSVEEDGIEVFLGYKPQVELYSLNNDSWKKIPDAPDVCISNCYSANVNGSHYWIASGVLPGNDSFHLHLVMKYDFTDGRFSYFPSPVDKEDELTFNLVDFDGLLGFTVIRGTSSEIIDKSLELWVLNPKKESWTKLYEVNNLCGYVGKLLGYWKGFFFFEGKNHQLLVYNYTTKELKKVDSLEKPKKPAASGIEIFPYVECNTPLQTQGYKMDTSDHCVNEEHSDKLCEHQVPGAILESKVACTKTSDMVPMVFGDITIKGIDVGVATTCRGVLAGDIMSATYDEHSVEFKRQKLDLPLD